MAGRRPQAGAIRRGGRADEALVAMAGAQPMTQGGPQEPAEVAANPEAHAEWLAVVGDGRDWRPEDAPLLASWCAWSAVASACRARLLTPEGVAVAVRDPVSGKAMRNPYEAALDRATRNLRQLGAELGITPLSRARLGVADAATKSMQLDVMAKIRELAATTEFVRP